MSQIDYEFLQPFERFRKLQYNDPIELMKMQEELSEQRSKPMQKKINAYIQKVAKVEFACFIVTHYLLPEIFIEVIGTKELNRSLVLQTIHPMYWVVSDTDAPRILKEFEIEPNLHGIFENMLREEYLSVFDNFALIPIKHSKNGKTVFHLGIVNFNSEKVKFDKTVSTICEFFSYNIGLVTNILCYEEERSHHQLTKNALSATFLLLDMADNLKDLQQAITKQLCDFFKAEFCYILIADNEKLVSKVKLNGVNFDFGYEKLHDVSVPFGTEIQGRVALKEKLISYNHSIGDVEYENRLHSIAGIEPRNVLCFPMYYRAELFGIIEIHNKIPACVFTKVDEEYTIPFGIICGYALGKCLSLKKSENYRFTQFKGDILLLRKILLKNPDISKVILCEDLHRITYNYFEFIPYIIPEKHLICYTVQIFQRTGFLERFGVNYSNLVWFLCLVRNGYSILPFHNWYHAFTVFHFLYMMISKYELVEKGMITKLEGFALLVSAICHDLELSGSTTRYQPVRGVVLASLYSSPGSAEKRFSACQVIRLFSIPEANILEDMSPNDFKKFIQITFTAITSTDLWDYLMRITNLSKVLEDKLYDPDIEEHKECFYSILMVTSDLCTYTKPWVFSKFVSDRQYKEFYRFRDLYYAINVFNLKNISPNPKKFAQLQVQFVKDICIPAYNYLQLLIPQANELYEKVLVILKKWHKQEEVKKNTHIEDSSEELIEKQISEDRIPDVLRDSY